MNKIVSVTINGSVFNIEDAAYIKLKSYLDEIDVNFSKEDDGEEIVKDIEAGISEKLKELLFQRKEKVIISEDIERLISVMGRVEDIAGGKTARKEKKEEKTEIVQEKINKKVYRDPDNMIIAGVCSGLAGYFGIDPTFVRILFVILAFFNGFGILAYLILWLIVPMAKTPTQKLEMKGEQVNLNKIKEFVADRAKEIKTDRPVRWVRKFARIFARVFILIVGVSLFAGLLAAMVGLTVGGVVGFIGAAGDPSSFPFRAVQTLSWQPYLTLIVSIYFAVLIPIIFLMIGSLSLLKRKSYFNLTSSIVMFVIWFVAVCVGSSVVVSHRQAIVDFIENERVGYREDSGKLSSVVYEFKNFDTINADGNYIVNIVPGNEFKVVANGSDYLLDNTDIETEDGELRIGLRKHFCAAGWCGLQGRVKFDISMPEIKAVYLSGLATGSVNGGRGDKILIKINGNSEFVAEEMMYKQVNIRVDGLSKARLVGQADVLDARLNGSSDLDAEKLRAISVFVDSDGLSQTRVYAIQSLNAHSYGASKIYYFGAPQITTETEGLSTIERVDE